MSDETKITPSEIAKAAAQDEHLEGPDVNTDTLGALRLEFDEFKTRTIQQVNDMIGSMNQMQQGLQMWMAQCEQSLHGHNVRINVFETIFSHEDFQELRDKFVAGTLKIDELITVAREHVLPELQRRMDEKQKEMEALMAQQEGQSESILGPDGQPAQANAVLTTPDGRPISLALDDDDDEVDNIDNDLDETPQEDDDQKE